MPKKFIDLLSDDKINRELLAWCKSWDEYVFNIKRVSKKKKKKLFFFHSIMLLFYLLKRNQQILQCFQCPKAHKLNFKIRNLVGNKPSLMILISMILNA